MKHKPALVRINARWRDDNLARHQVNTGTFMPVVGASSILLGKLNLAVTLHGAN